MRTLFVAAALSLGAGCSRTAIDGPCAGVTCSDHGQCVALSADDAGCVCDAGYTASADLQCTFSGTNGGDSDPRGGDTRGGDTTGGDTRSTAGDANTGDTVGGDTAGGDDNPPPGDGNRGDTLGGDTEPPAGDTQTPGDSLCGPIVSAAVEPLFAGFTDWSVYVTRPPGVVDPTTLSPTACDSANAPGYFGCYHAGEARRVATNETSCAGLRARDDLDAFEWRCSAAGGTAVLYSVRLQAGRGLRDLLSGLTLRQNAVTVSRNGCDILRTSITTWWTNPVAALPVNSVGPPTALTVAGMIWVSTAPQVTSGYNLDADNASIVTLPGSLLTYDGTVANNCDSAGELIMGGAGHAAIVCAGGQTGLWIEADIDGGQSSPPTGMGFALRSSNMVRIHGSHAARFALQVGSFNGVDNLGVTDSSFSASASLNVDLNATSDRATWTRSRLDNNDSSINFNVSGNHAILNELVVSQSNADNIFINGVDVVVTGTLVTSAASTGLYANGARVTVQAFAGIHNANEAVHVGNAFGTFNNIVSINNIVSVSLTNGSHEIRNVFATDSTTGLLLNTSPNTFVLPTLVFDNNMDDCFLTGNVMGVTLDTNCNHGPLLMDVPLVAGPRATTIAGKVTSDMTNLDDISGARLYTMIGEWSRFDSHYRAWGNSDLMAQFPDPGFRGRCTTGETCRIWDYRPRQSDTNLRNFFGAYDEVTCPPSADASNAANVRQNQRQPVSQDYLASALEIVGDYIGNEDGLCETDEACIYSPNLGAYQGEGALLGPCIFTDGPQVQRVTLYGYGFNSAP